VRRNRQVDVRALTRAVAGGITLMTNPDEDVKVLETNDVTASAYQEQDRLNMDFDEISGNMSQSSVAANRRLNETVGGMEILSADANKVRAYGIKTFIETWAEPVLRQLILLEQAYETDETILALVAGKSKEFQRLGMDAVTDELLMQELVMSVSIGMNATSPTQKINNLLTGINGVKTALADGVLAQHGVDSTEVIKEIFGALGHKDGGRFFKFDGDQDPQIATLQQQIQQLQQQLDAKHPPELIAAQVKEIEARIGKTDADKVAKMVEACLRLLFSCKDASSRRFQKKIVLRFHSPSHSDWNLRLTCEFSKLDENVVFNSGRPHRSGLVILLNSIASEHPFGPVTMPLKPKTSKAPICAKVF
jgi:hypothetical protein